jgi:hypothetical protein
MTIRRPPSRVGRNVGNKLIGFSTAGQVFFQFFAEARVGTSIS